MLRPTGFIGCIHPSEITIVLQGPLVHAPDTFTGGIGLTEFCALNYRRLFPEAEIVVSTWEGGCAKPVGVDILVKSKDPGALSEADNSDNKFVNINRQIVSTTAGLKAATRRWVLKSRTDTTLTNSRLVEFYSATVGCKKESDLLGMPVLVACSGSVTPSRMPMLFHLSDFLQFGMREDLLKYWNARLACSEEALCQIEHPAKNRRWAKNLPLHRVIYPSRCAAEQYLLLELMKTEGKEVKLAGALDSSIIKYFISEAVLIRHFIFFPCWAPEMLQPGRLAVVNCPKSRFARVDSAIVNGLSGNDLMSRLYMTVRMPIFLIAKLRLRIEAIVRFVVKTFVPPRITQMVSLRRLAAYRERVESVNQL